MKKKFLLHLLQYFKLKKLWLEYTELRTEKTVHLSGRAGSVLALVLAVYWGPRNVFTFSGKGIMTG